MLEISGGLNPVPASTRDKAEAAYLTSRFAARGMRQTAQARGHLDSGFLSEAMGRKDRVIENQESLLLNRLMAALVPALTIGLGIIIAGVIVSILLAVLSVNDLAI